MSAFFYGILGGIVAWVATAFVGQPFFHFLNLRNEIAKVLALYEDRYDVTNPERKFPDDDWRTKRRLAYELVGAHLMAFAASNSLVTRILHRLPASKFRCYPRNAGNALMLLGEALPGTASSEQLKEQVTKALKLGYRP